MLYHTEARLTVLGTCGYILVLALDLAPYLAHNLNATRVISMALDPNLLNSADYSQGNILDEMWILG